MGGTTELQLGNRRWTLLEVLVSKESSGNEFDSLVQHSQQERLVTIFKGFYFRTSLFKQEAQPAYVICK